MKLIIFSGSKYSEYSQGLLEFAHRNGYEVGGVVIRRAFTLQRLKEELNRLGWSTLRRVFETTLSILKIYSVRKSGWSLLLSEYSIKRTELLKLCVLKNIKFIEVDDVNCQDTYEFIKQIRPDIALFGGGGILRQPLLDCVKVINCHMGILPEYKGSYPWIWAILNNDLNKIGVSAHLMSSDIDTGHLLKMKHINLEGLVCVDDIETALEYAMVETIFDGLRIFEESESDYLFENNKSQVPVKKMYYVPHPSLFRLADELFKNRKKIK
jgi:methionyl-tRNA formyltransferase